MTIDEIRQCRILLEKQIEAELQEFRSRTGLGIVRCSIEKIMERSFTGLVTSLSSHVRLETESI